MRVIAGSAKGAKLRVPDGVSRPTTDRVREAIFSILGERVPGATVCDLYAGSGALGIEALSRGAASALFVECDERASGVIGANLEVAGLEGGRVCAMEVERFLGRGGRERGPFDLVFADPPYWKAGDDVDRAGQVLAKEGFREIVAADGIVILEVRAGTCEAICDDWDLLDRRGYGGTEVLFLEAGSEG
ncbi:MAG: 16S rRNA (guanine(966)-N(2))-methyltransferase RsmD [Verrucomicrobiota bacterium]